MDGKIQYYPLTHPQKGIWYTEKLHPGTSIANIAGTIKLKEALDYSLLEKAINILIEKNDSLRLHFVETENGPRQYVSRYSYCKLDFFDFSTEGMGKIYEWDTRQTQAPFALLDSDLFYIALVKINDDSGGIYVKIHHLLGDGWTMVSFPREIIKYYNSLKNNLPLDENNRPSYTEYILSEENYLRSRKFYQDREFWDEKLRTIPDLAALKAHKFDTQDVKAKRKTFLIPVRLALKIREFCHENRSSIFILFLAALSMYVNRITSKEDLIFGTPVLNRSNAREKETMGMFVSTAPIRVKVNDSQKFTSFINEISKEWMSVLRHQKYPFDLLLRELREKNKGMEKLYDIALSYQNGKLNKANGNIDYEGRWHFNSCQTESLYIHINDREDDGNILIDYDYLDDIYYAKEIEFLHDHMTRLLWHALDNPSIEIFKIDMISEKEKHKVLYEFNNTKTYFPRDKTIHKLFEEQVESTPDHTAVIFGEYGMTYRELNEKANQLARFLRRKGIGPECVVGVMAHRSHYMIVGLLGILKSGAAYLPIEPEHPKERIRYLLEESKAEILLTNTELADQVSFKGEVIKLDNSSIFRGDATNPDFTCQPENLAYIIFTSGTTGQPKGVMIEHRSIVNTLLWRKSYYGFSTKDVVGQIPSFSFDSSVEDIFTPLISGSRLLILRQKGNRFDLEHLRSIIIKEKVTHLLMVPSLYRTFLGTLSQAPEGLQFITVAGEDFTRVLIREHFKKLAGVRLYNEYGPTENSVCSTVFEIKKENTGVLIGKPISNTRCYILSRFGCPQPIGIPGELYVSGLGLARGYMNRPGLTDEKFIPNPFMPGEKMYRTGDLARWYPKGDIEFLGRVDQQVKIRGFRIELGEIENRISLFDGVQETVVAVRHWNDGRKDLCAYIVADSRINFKELKKQLSISLPDYMIPVSFMQIDKIPLTFNGKVDRNALPEPETTGLTADYAAPTNDVEEKLCAICAEILGIGRIGIDDNIFELGADSLSILTIQAACFQFDWRLSAQDFYEGSTIRLLSEKIMHQRKSEEAVKFSANEYVSWAMDEMAAGRVNYANNGDKNFLLTGVTGFLGVHLLHEIISQDESVIYCIVRKKDDLEANERLSCLLDYYFAGEYKKEIGRRIRIIEGDITSERFGLDEDAYAELGRNVDMVVNAAALVKHYGEYSLFEAVNVSATRNLADFAMRFGKHLYHISTTSVFGRDASTESPEPVVFNENDFSAGQGSEINVYIRSKIEAELLLANAMKSGLNATIFRIGNLTGRYADGLFQINGNENAFYNRLRAVCGLGRISGDLMDIDLEFTPVDCCSKALIGLIRLDGAKEKVYHVFNYKTIKMERLIKYLQDIGVHIDVVENPEFLEYLQEVSRQKDRRELLIGLINDYNENRQNVYIQNKVVLDHAITDKYLHKLGFEWFEPDFSYISKVVRYFWEN